MSEVKDPAIKLFGRTISLPLIPNDSSSSAAPPAPTSPPCEVSSASQLETEEPSRKELTSEQDNESSHQTTEDLKSGTTSSSMFENPKTPSAERETSLLKSSTNGEQSESSVSQDKAPKKPDKILPCPRCNSMDTKFCYYNNYNVNQPRHFCKNCQRYWTAGGTMRNVPVGAGRRKNKNSTASQYRHIMIPEALQGPASLNAPNGLHNAVLAFGPDSPLCDSMSSVLSIADHNKAPNGFRPPPEPSTYVSYGSRDDDGNDHSIGVSATTCSASHESISDKRIEGFPPPPQLAYFPSSSPWPYPWNSPVAAPPPPPPPHAFCPPGYPVSFYTTPPSYWGCVGPSWNVPCVSPQSSVNHTLSGPNSPLGKHSRDGSIITTTQKENPNNIEQNNSESNNVLIPKTLRIDDPSEAAKSSIWSTLGIKNDKANSLNGGGGLFKAFPSSKGNDKSHASAVEASPVLHANPAALSRSLTFHERT